MRDIPGTTPITRSLLAGAADAPANAVFCSGEIGGEGGGVGEGGAEEVDCAPVTGLPQEAQNLALPSSGWPQLVQNLFPVIMAVSLFSKFRLTKEYPSRVSASRFQRVDESNQSSTC